MLYHTQISEDELNQVKSVPSLNNQIRTLERHLQLLPQTDVFTKNHVHGEMCARTIVIPKDTVLTGTETNIDNICVMYGDITVTTSDGSKRLKGFHILCADKGFKRAGYAHEETYWTTIHHTKLTDMADIEKEMTAEFENLQTRAIGVTLEEEIKCLG